jgi:hypothetical protein
MVCGWMKYDDELKKELLTRLKLRKTIRSILSHFMIMQNLLTINKMTGGERIAIVYAMEILFPAAVIMSRWEAMRSVFIDPQTAFG